MNTYTLLQGAVSANLSEVSYSPVSSDVENNTPYVIEDSISAVADKDLKNGPATVHYNGKSYPVTITKHEIGEQTEGDGEEEEEMTFEIDLEAVDGSLLKLAEDLDLLEGHS